MAGRHLVLLAGVVDRATARRGLRLGQVIVLGAVDALLEDGLGVIHLELGLEVGDVMAKATAVRPTTGIGEVEGLVLDLATCAAPIFPVSVKDIGYKRCMVSETYQLPLPPPFFLILLGCSSR